MAVVAFTGHRDRRADFDTLLSEVLRVTGPETLFRHGGAEGFDTQVAKLLEGPELIVHVYKPNYDKYGNSAPLKRNDAMLNGADLLIACWDGRKQGGTFYTICQAAQMGIKTIILPAYYP